jgi:alpha-tubulin suppressor-like RCC1 family protein
VVAIAAGHSHNLALRADGTVAAWGWNRFGQCDVPAGLSNVVSVAAGDFHSLALRADGLVVVWGHYREDIGNGFVPAVAPSGLTNVAAIASGTDHDLALAGHGPPSLGWGLANRAACVGGRVHFRAHAAGQAPLHYQWSHQGAALPGATNEWLELSGVQTAQAGSYALSVSNVSGVVTGATANLAVVPALIVSQPQSHVGFLGEAFTLSVEAQATVPLSYQWLLDGAVLPGATKANLTLSNLTTALSGGSYSVLVSNSYGVVTSGPARVSAGWLAGWGASEYGQAEIPEGLSNVVALACGYTHNLALRRDGTVLGWGFNEHGETDVPPGLSNVVAIAAGSHSVALRADGKVVIWGSDDYYATNLPPGATNVVAIACQAGATLVLRGDGTVVAWGGSYAPTMSEYDRQAVPAGLTNVVAIASGDYFSLALRSDGTVAVWGYGFFGETNLPAALGNVVGIACGGYHGLALRWDGTVAAWGAAWAGTNVPSGLTDVVGLAAGYSHSAVLRADGAVVAWHGDYDYGQANLPPGLRSVSALAARGNRTLALLGAHPTPAPRRLGLSLSPGVSLLRIAGPPGNHCAIEYAATLSPVPQWRFLRNTRLTNAVQTEPDRSLNGATQRFYRVRLFP